MTILVTVLIGLAVLSVIGASILAGARLFHRASAAGGPSPRLESPPFGALSTLSDPVGPLGNPAPEAELSSNADSEHQIYGE